MLGIGDPWSYLAYVATFLSAAACVWYGIANWDKGGETEEVAEKEGNQMGKTVVANSRKEDK